jgi:hypothetical protein
MKNCVPYASVAAGAANLISSSMVFAADGDESAVAVGLFFAGWALAIAAGVGYGLSRRPGRRALVAVGAPLLVTAWIMAIGDLLTPLFKAFSEKEYVNDEGPLIILAVVLLVLGARAGRNRERNAVAA